MFFAFKEIQQLLAARVVHQSIDRKIAARGSLARPDGWIERNFETLMPWRHLRVAARDREVEGVSIGHRQLNNAERSAHEVRFPPSLQRGHKLFVAETKNLDIVVLNDMTEQPIANASPDQVSRVERGRFIQNP